MKHTPNILYEKNNILYGTYTKTLSIQFGENLRKNIVKILGIKSPGLQQELLYVISQSFLNQQREIFAETGL